jgi:hypothetical protein
MYSPETHQFSYSYRLAEGSMMNVQEPSPQFKYTLNSLMGMHKAGKAGYPLFCDIARDYAHVVARGGTLLTEPENLAAALWAGESMGVEVPSALVDTVRNIVQQPRGQNLTAQALAWMILGSVGPWSPTRSHLPALLELALDRYVHPQTFLVRHVPIGFRRSIASFAASCYTAYALLTVAARTGDRRAHEAGVGIARSLMRLQGPQGQWAWFYNVSGGTVLDYYPVYSVHQHSMAPMFLLAGIDLGHMEFREPLVKGFGWILRANEVGVRMVCSERQIIWRSVERSRRFSKLSRGISAFWPASRNAGTARSSRDLRLNTECRSYELGWGLWAFAGREDFDEILDDPAFTSQDTIQAG